MCGESGPRYVDIRGYVEGGLPLPGPSEALPEGPEPGKGYTPRPTITGQGKEPQNGGQASQSEGLALKHGK